MVERRVNAAAVGQGEDARDDVFRTVVDDVINSGRSRIGFPFSGANAPDDHQPAVFGEFCYRAAYATGDTCDENAFEFSVSNISSIA